MHVRRAAVARRAAGRVPTNGVDWRCPRFAWHPRPLLARGRGDAHTRRTHRSHRRARASDRIDRPSARPDRTARFRHIHVATRGSSGRAGYGRRRWPNPDHPISGRVTCGLTGLIHTFIKVSSTPGVDSCRASAATAPGQAASDRRITPERGATRFTAAHAHHFATTPTRACAGVRETLITFQNTACDGHLRGLST